MLTEASSRHSRISSGFFGIGSLGASLKGSWDAKEGTLKARNKMKCTKANLGTGKFKPVGRGEQHKVQVARDI